MSYLPAKRLENIAPIFTKKGRVALGASVNLVISDTDKIQDHGTYENPHQASTGMHHVFINGRQFIESEVLIEGILLSRHLSLQQ